MFAWIQVIVAVLATLLVLTVYDRMIDDPLVMREARAGYVLQSERDALKAQLAKERLIAEAATKAAEHFKQRYAAQLEAARLNAEKAEKDIAEDNLVEDGAPRVTSDDLEWFELRHRQ